MALTRIPLFEDDSTSQLPATPSQDPNPNIDIVALLNQASERYGVDPDLVRRVAHQESRNKPGAVSPKGAVGVMQTLPGTFSDMGGKDINDPAQQIDAGVKYLRKQLDDFGGDTNLALAAYNAGPGAVRKAGGVPNFKETLNYIKKIQGQDVVPGTAAPKVQPQTVDSEDYLDKAYRESRGLRRIPLVAPEEPVDEVAQKPQEKTGPSGFIDTVIGGAKSTARNIGATVDLAQLDNEELQKSVAEQDSQKRDPRLAGFIQEIAAWKKQQSDSGNNDPGWGETAQALLNAAINNPAGAGLLVAEQLPNSAVTLGTGYVGLKAGAAGGGLVGGPPGAVIGGVIGGIAGLFGGNALIEGGDKALSAAREGPVDEAKRSDVLGQTARKAGVITGVDVATLGITNAISGAVVRAIEKATVQTLAKSGVDVSNKAAVLAARNSQEIVAKVQEAQQLAKATVTTVGNRVARAAAKVGVETVGEGAGEYGGEYAATGKLDKMEALLEAFSSLGTSAGEIVATNIYQGKKEEGATWADVPPPNTEPPRRSNNIPQPDAPIAPQTAPPATQAIVNPRQNPADQLSENLSGRPLSDAELADIEAASGRRQLQLGTPNATIAVNGAQTPITVHSYAGLGPDGLGYVNVADQAGTLSTIPLSSITNANRDTVAQLRKEVGEYKKQKGTAAPQAATTQTTQESRNESTNEGQVQNADAQQRQDANEAGAGNDGENEQGQETNRLLVAGAAAREEARVLQNLASSSPEAQESAVQSGFAKRNKDGKAVLLPAGRRRITELSGVQKAVPSTNSEQAPKANKQRGKVLTDARLNNQDVSQELKRLASVAGWGTIGGRLTRDADGNVGRTSWVPNEPWYAGLSERLNTAASIAAVDKALAGEPLSAKENRAVQALLDVADEHVNPAPKYDAEGEAEREAIINAAVSISEQVDDASLDKLIDAAFNTEQTQETLTDEEIDAALGLASTQAPSANAQENDTQGSDGNSGADSAQARDVEGQEAVSPDFAFAGQTNQEILDSERGPTKEEEEAERRRQADLEVDHFSLQSPTPPKAAAKEEASKDAVDKATDQVDMFAPSIQSMQEKHTKALEGRQDARRRIMEAMQAKDDFAKADAENDLEKINAAGEALDAVVISEVKRRIAAGEMPVFKGNLTYAIHPSTKEQGKWQVTRYSDTGILGDSAYNSLTDAVKDNQLSHKELLEKDAAKAEMDRLTKAEGEYQARKPAVDNQVDNTHAKQGEVVDNKPEAKASEGTQDTFVKSPDGSTDFGEIADEQASAMHRQAGKIKLPKGVQNSDGTGYGLVHIEANHGKQIRSAGFDSVESFVSHIAKDFGQAWQAEGRQLLVAFRDDKQHMMYVQLEPAKDDSGDYYRVNSAFPVRQEDYPEKHGFKKLWDGSEPASTVTGEQPAFAGQPENTSGQATPNARGQSDANIAPTTDNSKASEVDKAKAILNDRNVTGDSYTRTIADVRRGDLTAQDVEEAHPVSKPEAKDAAPQEPAVIGDFGQKIEGAKKDLAAAVRKEYSDDDLATLPLSKIWPADLADKIEDKLIAAMAYAARQEIPSKPRVSYKVKNWIGKVKILRGLVNMLVASDTTRARAEALLNETKALAGFASKVHLLESLDRDQWSRIGSVREYPDSYTYEEGKQVPAPHVQVQIDGRTQIFYGAKSVADVIEQVNEKLGVAATASKMKFEVRGRGNSYFINKAGDSEYRHLKEFTTSKEAADYRNSNYNDLVAAWEAVKDRDNVKEADVRGEENRPRTAQDWRKGRDIGTDEFQSTFGFKGGQFGNWVSQGKNAKDRQGMLNDAFDAYMDLADILGIPPKAISLNGELGMSFGARGSGRASAHYESDQIVINLTKTRGAGTLAHEWFHALDNYFQRSRNAPMDHTRPTRYITYKPEAMYVHKGRSDNIKMSRAELNRRHEQDKSNPRYDPQNWEKDPSHAQGVRPEVEEKFAALVESLNASPMKARASLIDKGAEDGYWSRIIELAARSFENYIIVKMSEKGYNNDYLANVKKLAEFRRDEGRYPYLKEEELAPVVEAFDNLFGEMQTKETERGTSLFSRDYSAPAPIFYSQLARAIDSASDKVFSNGNQTALWLQANAPKLQIKSDELQFSGVLDYLKLRGKEKVTKSEVTQFLDQNGVKVTETTLDDGDWAVYDGDYNQYFGSQKEANDYAREMGINITEDTVFRATNREGGYGTKFASYQLPGGENYRELLLTLPTENLRLRAEGDRIGRLENPTPEEIEIFRRANKVGMEKGSVFTSSHFDQPNILAHIRFNERTDADGNRVLFLEEIQSDWGQKGKKEGFSDAGSTQSLSQLEAEHKDVLQKMGDLNDYLYAFRVNKSDARSNTENLPMENQQVKEKANERDRLIDRSVEINQELSDIRYGRSKYAPAAPFVTDTKAWVALSLKRMIRYAAENGFQKIAWANGTQQAARYDLSKQIDSISWYKNPDDGTYSLDVYKNEKIVTAPSKLDANGIADIVGKDIADKITSTESDNGELSGLDLKVGGTGMKAFYDSIVPSVANDVLKKLGGEKVEALSIDTQGTPENGRGLSTKYAYTGPEYTSAEMVQSSMRNKLDNATLEAQARDVANALRSGDSFAKAMEDNGSLSLAEKIGGKLTPLKQRLSEQQSFTITDAMREKVLTEGQAQFSRSDQSVEPGLAVSDVQAVADLITRTWENAPRIHVLSDWADLRVPADLKFNLKKTNAINTASAALHNGEIYLNAAKQQTAEQVQSAILHEATHLGLEGMFGKKALDQVLMNIYLSHKEVREKADKFKKKYKDLKLTEAVNEVLAVNAGNKEFASALDRLKAWFIVQLRKLGFNISIGDAELRILGFTVSISDAELRTLVSNALAYSKDKAKATHVFNGSTFSRGNSVWEHVVEAWNNLGSDMATFQNQTPDSFDMESAAREIDPGMQAYEDIPEADEPSTVKKWFIKMPDNTHAYAYENDKGEVWLNASNLSEGSSGGTKLYLLVGSYAEANGKVFIGDPAGLSDIALLRRTENMVSLALRFGSTKFLEPHKNQVNPGKKFESVLGAVVRPINWVKGDNENNMAELLQTSYDNTITLVPEIQNVVFNFDNQRFEHTDGQEFTDKDFDDLSKEATVAYRESGMRGVLERARGVSREMDSRDLADIGSDARQDQPRGQAGDAAKPTQTGNRDNAGTDGRLVKPPADVQSGRIVGSATLKRAAITNTVARAEGASGRRNVLAAISAVVRRGLSGTQLAKTQYSRPYSHLDNLQAELAGNGNPPPSQFSRGYGEAIRSVAGSENVRGWVASTFDNDKSLSPWMRSVGTQYHKAVTLEKQGMPHFKRVFDLGQDFLSDISAFAIRAEKRAPHMFKRAEGLGDLIRGGVNRKDVEAISKPLFEGTLNEKRVFTDAELTRKYRLTAPQVVMYREALAAANQSLDDVAKALIAKHAQVHNLSYTRESSLSDLADEVGEQVNDADLLRKIRDIAAKPAQLAAEGYFPLMRFGNHTVTMTDQAGETQFFGLYESQHEANKVKAALAEDNRGMHIETGIMSKEAFKLYGGLNLEALQLFANEMDVSDNPMYQGYLKNAVNNRSVLKRLIHRKGTPGFSTDVERTLAQFITSNARHASSQYNLFKMREAAEAVPKRYGDVKDEAIKLWEYVSNPVEEASKLRGYLFFNFLGGSVASAMVNLTQTPMITAPYLSQYTSAGGLLKAITTGAKMALLDPAKVTGALGVALRRAEERGITAPQEIHQLTATASNNLFSSNHKWNAALKAWGGMFAMAEVFNRRSAFIAAFNIAKERGDTDKAAYDFARVAVDETQFIYTKANRPNWARGTAGSLIFTFKQYSISYIELFKRLPPKQQLIMLGVLILASGLEGLPFEEDLLDLIDTLGQWGGFATSSKRWLRETATATLGKQGAALALNGISAVLPIDIQGRLGMHNLLPGTSALKQSEVNKGRDVQEFAGPAGSVLVSAADALEQLAKGNFARAALAIAPRAVVNAYEGGVMLATGEAKDKEGRKVLDVSITEGAGKAIGFNPTRKANLSEHKRALIQDRNLLRVKEDGIVTTWVNGILKNKPEEIASAKRQLADWNEKNPDLRIAISPNQIKSRVRNARIDSDVRFIRSLPKEQRVRARGAFEDGS